MSYKIIDLVGAPGNPAGHSPSATDLFEIVSSPGGSGEASEARTLGDMRQIICTSDADPNAAAIFPPDRTAIAVFHQDPSINVYSMWKWSPLKQKWYQMSG